MQLSTPRPSVLGELPPGSAGTRATLDLMRRLVARYKRSDAVRSVALALTRGLPPKNYTAEVRAVFEFVRDRIRYVRDVIGVETLQTPDVTLDLEAGDCDDKATLLASLLASIGHRSRFVAVGYTQPGAFQHVYLETLIGQRWVPLDATVSSAVVGWAPRTPVTRMTVHN